MIQGILVLLTFQLLGETITSLTNAPVPGPVIGMLLLFIALRLRQRVSQGLQATSHGLIQHLSLLFLPAGVGFFFLPASVQQQWPAIVGAMVGGTLLAMLLSAWLIKTLAPKNKTGDEP